MTLINGDLILPSELHDRDPLVRHAKRKAELKAEEERRERRQRPKLDIRPLTPAEVDARVVAAQHVQDKAIGAVIGEAQAEIARLRGQVDALTTKLSFVEGLLQGSSSGAKLKFFNVRGQFREGERYDRTDVVTRGDAWYVAKRDDPRSAPGDGEDWLSGPVGKRGEPGRTGERGERGRDGRAGKDAQTIQCWLLDRTRYVVTPIMSDGTKGSTLELRALFEAYHSESWGAMETIVERGVAEMARRR